MALVQTPAILLRSYPFSETSRTLRFYSLHLGVVGVMARGVRKSASKHGGGLLTFTEGTLTAYVRANRDLQTFKDFSDTRTRPALSSSPIRLAGASVLGELTLAHAGQDENPPLFHTLSVALDRVSSEGLETLFARILAEVWGLVAELGYRPSVGVCVECGRELDGQEMSRFDFPAGGVRCLTCAGDASGPRLGPRARGQLLALVRRHLPADLARPRAHLRLVSDFITYHISGGTPLKSLEILAALTADTDA